MSRSAATALVFVGLAFFFFALVFRLSAPESIWWTVVPAALGVLFAAFGGLPLLEGTTVEGSSLSGGDPVRLGGVARVTLHLVPTKRLKLDVAHCSAEWRTLSTLVATGTDERSVTDTVFQRAIPLTLPEDVSQPLEHEITFEVPTTVPPTWHGRRARFRSEIRARIDLAGGASMLLTRPVIVLPEVAGA